ncbi:hypothetical protein FSP39_011527 [Pinctada imbricata]|uniref:carbonyl reductase (NADPH) n=1 Tax=Pinctada imbricata TaxID=66713 RepID=A0AA89BX97_PINIB|nr:hypothetical protein FSP39_011527 [Pinctada imbricata]
MYAFTIYVQKICAQTLNFQNNTTNPLQVTGGNKGIGYGVVRGLCKGFDGDVYLTARNEELGQAAVKELSDEIPNNKPKFHQLDISDQPSIDRLRDFLKEKYGGLDVLVNNAAIAYKASSTAKFPEQARETIRINYTATINVCNALFPLLRPHARVVNVSSFVSTWAINKCSAELKAKFSAPDLEEKQCTALLDEFVRLAQDEKHEKNGYANTAYGMSKVGVSALSQIQGRVMTKDKREDILIMAADPGSVNTDMSSHRGNKNLDDGADTLVYLALLKPGCGIPNGSFVSERKVRDWVNDKIENYRYVTGGNKGIGFAVVRGICKDFKGEIDVFLTARDEGRGKEAVQNLTAELSTTKNKPKFHQLDITDKSSIDRLRDFIQKEYGGLDILVNNAAIAFKGSSDVPFPQQAKDTIETNYTATVNICNALFPLLREHAR